MSIIYQVDSFTNQKFKGNPAGVMLLENVFLEEDLMQNIVKEMNVSEVAFVLPKEDHFLIRFFTPKAEVPLCGHATLSAAHILYELDVVSKSESIVFQAPKDQLEISFTSEGYQMKFPEYTLTPISTSNWAEVLGLNIKEAFEVTNDWTMLVLETEGELHNFVPNASELQSLGLGQCIFTAVSNPAYVPQAGRSEERDIVCRCFVPNLNILEDPVTGSAHCALGVYWSKVLGKNELKSEQISERKGQLKLEMKNDSVYILGQAKTVFKAEFYL
ncbi:PhzF family phenazine biosynthesis protein [Psychroflexus sp. CAK8W]|uniref:PhzF family phenazine biosynthesis protein n=1 Tax=Psychroflexus longus TaxID=2873596 RepID=A0ABS7XL83_9FLAO|nr:PhzF family phenazine biosynthesis protein [Psychroflexus longus]MBZ9779742.1 PhzF family phenazine biosynthesis protein [Psychroflexus longus]